MACVPDWTSSQATFVIIEASLFCGRPPTVFVRAVWH
jgi:hypothetical protein